MKKKKVPKVIYLHYCNLVAYQKGFSEGVKYMKKKRTNCVTDKFPTKPCYWDKEVNCTVHKQMEDLTKSQKAKLPKGVL